METADSLSGVSDQGRRLEAPRVATPTLYRARIRLIAGNHGGTVYRATTGRIVNIILNDPKPYGCRLNGCPSWDIQWFSRDAFEVIE